MHFPRHLGASTHHFGQRSPVHFLVRARTRLDLLELHGNLFLLAGQRLRAGHRYAHTSSVLQV